MIHVRIQLVPRRPWLRLVELVLFGVAGVLAGCDLWDAALEIAAGYCFGRALVAWAMRGLQ